MNVINFTGDAWEARVGDGDPYEDALRIADAVGELAHELNPDARVYVGFDSRSLSRSLAPEMAEVVAGHGITCYVSDACCPSCVLAEAVRLDSKAIGGIMLTAGNKPADYFGIRVCMADGSPATSGDTDVLESHVVPELPSARGEAEPVDLMTRYLERTSGFIDGYAIAVQTPLVVCDPMYGSMCGHAARLLGSLGARVIEIHADDEDDFGGLHPDAAEPWIDECEQVVGDQGAAWGVAIDGAGERIALIDELGRYVTPHKMLALIMGYLVRERGITGRMVVPIFVSSVVRRQAARLGLQLTVTPAGYMWMREEMLAGNVVCAGDALGGVGIPALGLERDALAAAAVLADCIARDGRPLSVISDALDEELGRMYYGRREVRMGAGAIQMLRNYLPGLNPAEMAGMKAVSVSHSAGSLRVELEGDAWVLVRPSASSPTALVCAEAPTKTDRDALLDAGAALALEPLELGKE